MKTSPTPPSDTRHRLWGSLALALVLFAAGFALANRYQLTHGVLYRAAANDWGSAASNFLWLALQALALAAAIVLLGRRLFTLALLLAFVSILVNLGYGQTLAEVLDAGKVSWMLVEARQAGSAAREFAAPLMLAGLQAAAAIGFFVAARYCARRSGLTAPGVRASAMGVALLLLPSLGTAPGTPGMTTERNPHCPRLALWLRDTSRHRR